MQYEIISYKYGSGIFNKIGNDDENRYRHTTDEKNRIVIDQNQIFEEKMPKNKLLYIYQNRLTEEPVINVFFVSDASLKRYLHNNSLIKKRIGKDYFINCVLYSHLDSRATV